MSSEEKVEEIKESNTQPTEPTHPEETKEVIVNNADAAVKTEPKVEKVSFLDPPSRIQFVQNLEKALELKNKGNDLFKAGNMDEVCLQLVARFKFVSGHRQL